MKSLAFDSLGLLALALSVCCLSHSNGIAAQFDSSVEVIHFDAGPAGSRVDADAIGLHADSEYEASAGFGWINSQCRGFLRPDLARSRDAVTIDGVAGRRLKFRADVASGEWIVLAKVEADYTEVRKVQVFLQTSEQHLNWQVFSRSPEPRRSRQKTYRVFQARTHVAEAGLTFELRGAEQDIGILAISLFKLPVDQNLCSHELIKQLEEAGSYQSETSLNNLLQKLEDESTRDSRKANCRFWHEQVQLLLTAEGLFEKRGWSWAKKETGLGMFDRMHQAVILIDGLLSWDGPQAELLEDRARYLRGRILYWLHRQGAGASEEAAAQRDLGKLHSRYPKDTTLAMYVGEKIDLSDPCDALRSASTAPAWSVAQREALCRMRNIAHWWVQDRQDENGEFGGKLGDDVELLRWWAPLVLAGDKIALKGWRKLADAVWKSDLVHEGYAAKVGDVEHAAEFIADTAPLMAVYSDDDRYLNRLAPTAKHAQSLWTGLTANRHRFFRSAWFSSTEIDNEPPKDRDLEYNTRAVLPLRYLAWRRPSPEIVDFLHEWSLAWVNAAMRIDKGKPKGIVPASVRFSDEAINGEEPNWYEPNMYWKYFNWEHHAGSLMLDQLLFTYTLTHDERLLQPMLLSLDLIRAKANAIDSDQPTEPGTATWAAAALAENELFWQVVEQWRFRSRDTRYDDLIMRYGSSYGRYRLTGDQGHLVRGLSELLESVRYNTPLLTTEAYHTDRVYVCHAELLKAMLTGDGVRENVSPYFAVSWEETSDDFTALVTDSGVDRLTIQLYSHSTVEKPIVMRLWQLEPGAYELRRKDTTLFSAVKMDRKGHRVRLLLSAQQETTISLSRNRESATQ